MMIFTSTGPTAPPMPIQSLMLEEKCQAARAEWLWLHLFSDPSQWWDKRFNKGKPKAPDFKHKTIKQALWINNKYRPSWVQAKLATLSPHSPQLSYQASRTIQLWEEFFSDPSQWWDNRNEKKNPRFPDFKHKTANKALWVDSKFNPSWVHLRLAAMVQYQEEGQSVFSRPEISGKVSRMEELWEDFFSDPSQWWDNRYIKKSPNFPDFKHKSTHEGLWIEGWLKPSWVKAKMATVALGSGMPDTFCDGYDVSKLCERGQLKVALNMVEVMVQQQNTQAPIIAYVSLLKGCAKKKALAEGKRVHALIVQSGLGSDVYIGNTLLDMYAKCGSVLDAHKVFDAMSEHNVFSWTAIISAHVYQGQGEEAINLFRQMEETGVVPDKVAFLFVLKACARIAALKQGKQLHSDIIKMGFDSDVVICNTLIYMYAKCRCIEQAHQVFDSICARDVVSWSAMIAGYAQNGLAREALVLYDQMKQEGVQPDNVTYAVLLNACASIAALEQGKQLHVDILRSGLESDVIVGNTLLDMYAKCGCIKDAREVFNKMSERDVVSWTSMIAGYSRCGCVEDAREVFDNMKERDVVSWNAMIAGYAQHGLQKEALALYQQLKEEGVQPDNVTYVILLKACASIAALEQGKQLHSDLIKSGFESDLMVGNTLVDMYAKCGCIEHARRAFDKMSEPDVVSWSTLIAGYTQNRLGNVALALYDQMKEKGVTPNNVTYVALVNACASIGALQQGKQFHMDIVQSGFESDVTLGNTLIDMYAKCGCIEHAREAFNKMRERDVVSWNAMIAGYVLQGLGREALTLYELMQHEATNADDVTFVNLLKACASIAALKHGKQLHAHIIRSGYESDLIVGSALVDMYAKCGSIDHARQVFDNMHDRDVVSWNAMIAGYAHQGHGKEAVTLLEQMQREGKKPNEVTYVSVLSACSHCGLVNEGRHLFDRMCKVHGIIPIMDHYACMVDLLGRAGCLADAKDFINKMPIRPNALVWRTLLGAARNHGHVELGRHAFDHIVKLEPKNAAAYVLLSNIYAAAGKMEEVAKIRKDMEEIGVTNFPACS